MTRAVSWVQDSFVPLLVVLLMLIGITLWLDSRAEAVAAEPTIVHVKRSDQPKLTVGSVEQGLAEAEGAADVDTEADTHPAVVAARKAIAQGNPKKARQALEAAVAADADNPVLLNELGVLLLRADSAAEAVGVLDRAVAVAPTYYRAHYNRGIALARSGRAKEALEAYTRTSALRPSHFNAVYSRGLLLLREGQADEARAALTAATRLAGGQRKARAYGALGLAYARLEKPERAAGAYRKAIEFEPDAMGARYNLALLRLGTASRAARAEVRTLIDQMRALDPGFAPAWFLEGRLASASGDDAAALKAYQTAGEKDPSFWKARYNAGIVALRLGKLDLATRLFTRLAEQQPKRSEFHFQLGRVSYKRDEYPAAAKHYQEAVVAAGGDYLEAQVNLGLTYRAMGQYPKALALFDALLVANANAPSVHMNRGITLMKTKAYAEARAALRQAIALRGDYVSAHYNLGKVEEAAGQKEAAIAAYLAALKIDADHRGALVNLGGVYSDLKRYDEAEATYRQVIAAYPTYSRAWINLGIGLGKRGRHADAVEAFRKVLALDSEHESARRYLGVALSRAGQVADGIGMLREALVRDPADVEARRALAGVLEDSGDRAGAEAELRRSLKLKPDHARVAADLASLLLKDKRSAEAMALLEPMVARGAATPIVRTRLGRAYMAQDKLPEARIELEKAYAARKSSVEVISALAKLEAATGHPDRAVTWVEQALARRPDSALLKRRLRKYRKAAAR